jgi:hypothetical protein
VKLTNLIRFISREMMDVNSVLGWLWYAHMESVPNISDVHATSVFRVELC